MKLHILWTKKSIYFIMKMYHWWYWTKNIKKKLFYFKYNILWTKLQVNIFGVIRISSRHTWSEEGVMLASWHLVVWYMAKLIAALFLALCFWQSGGLVFHSVYVIRSPDDHWLIYIYVFLLWFEKANIVLDEYVGSDIKVVSKQYVTYFESPIFIIKYTFFSSQNITDFLYLLSKHLLITHTFSM